MDLDDEVCLCFHVTQRKLRNYLRTQKVRQPSQLSECQGAGTGCGWCRPFLERLFREHHQYAAREAAQAAPAPSDLPSAQDYAQRRQAYLQRRDASKDTPS